MEDHDRWFGFAESKVKKIVQLLENYDSRKLYGMLEFRTHAKAY
jgi:poly(A) polymerase Pap1